MKESNKFIFQVVSIPVQKLHKIKVLTVISITLEMPSLEDIAQNNGVYQTEALKYLTRDYV